MSRFLRQRLTSLLAILILFVILPSCNKHSPDKSISDATEPAKPAPRSADASPSQQPVDFIHEPMIDFFVPADGTISEGFSTELREDGTYIIKKSSIYEDGGEQHKFFVTGMRIPSLPQTQEAILQYYQKELGLKEAPRIEPADTAQLFEGKAKKAWRLHYSAQNGMRNEDLIIQMDKWDFICQTQTEPGAEGIDTDIDAVFENASLADPVQIEGLQERYALDSIHHHRVEVKHGEFSELKSGETTLFRARDTRLETPFTTEDLEPFFLALAVQLQKATSFRTFSMSLVASEGKALPQNWNDRPDENSLQQGNLYADTRIDFSLTDLKDIRHDAFVMYPIGHGQYVHILSAPKSWFDKNPNKIPEWLNYLQEPGDTRDGYYDDMPDYNWNNPPESLSSVEKNVKNRHKIAQNFRSIPKNLLNIQPSALIAIKNPPEDIRFYSSELYSDGYYKIIEKCELATIITERMQFKTHLGVDPTDKAAILKYYNLSSADFSKFENGSRLKFSQNGYKTDVLFYKAQGTDFRMTVISPVPWLAETKLKPENWLNEVLVKNEVNLSY